MRAFAFIDKVSAFAIQSTLVMSVMAGLRFCYHYLKNDITLLSGHARYIYSARIPSAFTGQSCGILRFQQFSS
jgi:hypothetical protein